MVWGGCLASEVRRFYYKWELRRLKKELITFTNLMKSFYKVDNSDVNIQELLELIDKLEKFK